MLQPKKTKYRKQQRGRMKGIASRGNVISFGEFGLQSLDCCMVTSRQIESARRAMSHHVKRGGKIWIRIFPDKPITARPAETRMGKGKGDIDHWAAVVRPGYVMFEMTGVDEVVAREALRLAAHKLPVKTRILVKHR